MKAKREEVYRNKQESIDDLRRLMFVSCYYLLGLNTPTMSLTAWYNMFLICGGGKCYYQ